MFKKIREFMLLKQTASIRGARHDAKKLEDSAARMLVQSLALRKNVESHTWALNNLQKQINADLETLRRSTSQYEATIEELREKNMVLQTTIDTLVASHKLLLARYEAEIAVETRRKLSQTMATGD